MTASVWYSEAAAQYLADAGCHMFLRSDCATAEPLADLGPEFFGQGQEALLQRPAWRTVRG
jgi:hypothetical protein